MSGLLSGVLPYLYSQGDRLKRHVGGLLGDPLGTLEQTAGQIQDNSHQLQGLLDRAMAGDKQAQGDAAEQALAGLLGFAPVGMTKVVGPQSAALETARRNAVKMLGLPEGNTAMDRAKALGFDTPNLSAQRNLAEYPYPHVQAKWAGKENEFFHGTQSDITAFSKNPKRMTADWNTSMGTHMAEDPGIASKFAEGLYAKNADGGNVMPLMVRGEVKDFGLETEMRDAVAKFGKSKGLLNYADEGYGSGFDAIQKLKPAQRRALAAKFSAEQNAAGVGALRYANAAEREGFGSAAVVVTDPARIRSRFAAFDPARINDNDLLGFADPALLALLGVGTGLGGYFAHDALKERK